VIYPKNFEIKTGFDRIRELIANNCLSSMGLELVDGIKFQTSEELISGASQI
jgi:DNA mismatch repair protein MutS2